MSLAMLLAAGVVVILLGIVAIVVALVFALHKPPAREGTTGMDTLWIVIGMIVIALVCCLAAGMAAVFLFGVPLLPAR
jgi:heme/copper-type cytochrome/quinol oxidase subunit 4